MATQQGPKVCPKCGRNMKCVETVLGLPAYIDPDKRHGSGEKINLKDAYPAVAYCCVEGCRYIELWAE
jgi:hypothetical protein